ncbi:PadR family transcriptional regulator [Compostimonas suwonensis]|uniref:PadR family transcriptional regulator n=1 Tax=Compostimonas suwonensis TaxID=1048394 RepID=A0A2M9BVW9_9MICO|nr:PadR family transcriptional regulator [Compostimonas suwonensis]PJJ62096.1 PadR family transcriptional regulator [Compostimonas suwonensis]
MNTSFDNFPQPERHTRRGRDLGRRGPHGHGRGQGFGPGFGPGHGFGAGFEQGFGPRGRQRAGRGDIRAAILSLLADGPSNGYGLIKAIAEKTAGAWRPSPGSVYPTLQQLVDEELIVTVGEGRRVEYTLSETGESYVAEHAEELAQAWEATAGRSAAATDLFESIGKLMGVVQQFRFAATDEQRAAATEKLDEARRALYLILAD